MLDDGETDWKVIAMNAKEAASRNINNLDDLYRDLVITVKEFFRVYKIPTGEPENEFGFDGDFKDAEFAKDVIK